MPHDQFGFDDAIETELTPARVYDNIPVPIAELQKIKDFFLTYVADGDEEDFLDEAQEIVRMLDSYI